MELRMVELVAHYPGAAAGGARTRLGVLGATERLPMRAPASVNLGVSTLRLEHGERSFGGVVWGGKEKERARFGGLIRPGKDGWRGRNSSRVWYALSSNSVAEAPRGSEVANPEQKVVTKQLQDVEKRGEQGGGESFSKEEEEEEEEELEKGYKMSRICDRLIEVFMIERTTVAQWKNLLALSKEWIRIRRHFYKRCRTNAKKETLPSKQRELLKLAREVKEVDDNMIRHDKLLADIERNTLEIDIIVANRRKEFTGDFFEHLQILSDCSPRVSRQDEIAAIAGKCLSLIEAYDAALGDSEDIGEAQAKFDDILNSSSLEAASNKIDLLARSKELDSTLLLLITKAWAAAKDDPMMKKEVKEIMFHLYNAAKKSMLKLVPDEIRIIKYLLSIPDPRQRFEAMTDSFSPGDELEEKNEHKLHTTPDKLRHWIKLVLDAYHTNKQSTMIKEAQNLMNPEVITRLEILMEFMDDQFIV